MVQLLFQLWVTILSQVVAGFVVVDVLDPLPHLPIVAVLKAILNLPPICSLSYSNSSLQVASGSTVQQPITSPKCSIPLPEQALHLYGHPRLFVGIDLDAFVHHNKVHAVL